MKEFGQSPFGRVLARRTQMLIVAVLALLVAGIFSLSSLLSRLAEAKSSAAGEETQPPTPPGMFRPTDAQWENLKIVPVKRTSFQTEHTACAPSG